jgi:hypothetical protein
MVEKGGAVSTFISSLTICVSWQSLNSMSRNITVATFAENALYKAEAYGANLRGPKILHDHGIKVALKSV